MNDYYSKSGTPGTSAQGASAPVRGEYALIEAAFDKLPVLTGNTLKLVRVNASETALESVAASALGLAASGANTDITSVYLDNTGLKIKDTNASHGLTIKPGSNITADRTLTLVTGDADRSVTLTGDLAMSGAFNLVLTITAGTNVTLPTTGTLATLAGAETLTNKTITIADNVFTVQDNGDATKQLRFELSGITTGNIRTLTVPDASTTLVGTDTTQTLTGKSLGASTTISAAPTMSLGSDADGDIYYRASNVLTRLAKGAANTKLFMNAGATAPEWAAGIAVTNTSYDVSTTGSLAITGVGFKPKAVLALSGVTGTGGTGIGFSAGAAGFNLFNNNVNAAGQWEPDGSFVAVLRTAAGSQGLLSLASLDADGATFTKAKGGTPSGTATVYFLFLR